MGLGRERMEEHRGKEGPVCSVNSDVGEGVPSRGGRQQAISIWLFPLHVKESWEQLLNLGQRGRATIFRMGQRNIRMDINKVQTWET